MPTPLLSQRNFPRLWLLFQNTIGGNRDKETLYRSRCARPRHVLEVGCSVGNTTPAFSSAASTLSYLGIDIDAGAIGLARRRYAASPRIAFACLSIEELARNEDRRGSFDLICLAGLIHHLDGPEARSVLAACAPLLLAGGRVLLIDPLKPSAADRWFVRVYMHLLEQGEFLRSANQLLELVDGTGLQVESTAIDPVGATPWSWPHCADFVSMALRAG